MTEGEGSSFRTGYTIAVVSMMFITLTTRWLGAELGVWNLILAMGIWPIAWGVIALVEFRMERMEGTTWRHLQ